jgi:hypothetical protein
MSDIDQPLFVYYSDVLPGVWAHLERHYRVARGTPTGWLTLLERHDDRGPTLDDLFDRRREGRPFVRTTDGTLDRPALPAPRLAARRNRRPLAFWLGERGGGIDFDLTVPPGARLQADAGLSQTIGLTAVWEHPRDVDVVASIVEPDRRVHELVRRRVLADGEESHGWRAIEADLSAWAGRSVVLRLEVRSDRALPPDRLAWLGSPRLAGPPAR